MNGKDFSGILDCYAGLLDNFQCFDDARILRAVASVLAETGTQTVAATCKKLEKLKITECNGTGEVGRFLSTAQNLQKCVEATSKKAIVDDLKRLLEFLPPFAELSAGQLREALQSQPKSATRKRSRSAASLSDDGIASYVHQLTDALGNDQAFSEVFNSLKKDVAVKAPVAKKIAREFAKKAGRTKADSLKLIWERHASVVGAKARAVATGDRTAG